MTAFLFALLTLFLGYNLYGRFVERVFAPDEREVPSTTLMDGVDYTPLPTWKATLIQLMNIAGTGPIFGALMGACFGPIVFLWIVFGSILGGAVHDYMSGMISARNNGGSIAEISGKYLGPVGLKAMRVISVVLLVLTGAVFVSTAAMLFANVVPSTTMNFWVGVILCYHALAIMLPINKFIGWLYPIFGMVLAVMAALVMGALLLSPDMHIPEFTLANLHPKEIPVWPFMFITVACGAISGFHSIQSPMIAKCINSEYAGRKVFYRAMILEAVIALIWAAAGMTFFGGTEGIFAKLSSDGPAGAVSAISNGLLGKTGAVLAILGVGIGPITSGGTAFRMVRTIMAEWTGKDQRTLWSRFVFTVPIVAAGAFLTQVNFSELWRYFSWSNQTLATVALWVATAYLIQSKERRRYSLLTALPATFMSAVVTAYILIAPEGFALPVQIGYVAGCAVAVLLFGNYLIRAKYLRLPASTREDACGGVAAPSFFDKAVAFSIVEE